MKLKFTLVLLSAPLSVHYTLLQESKFYLVFKMFHFKLNFHSVLWQPPGQW